MRLYLYWPLTPIIDIYAQQLHLLLYANLYNCKDTQAIIFQMLFPPLEAIGK